MEAAAEGDSPAADAPSKAGPRAVAAIALIAVGTAWNAGNVGAVVGDLTREFELSLATIGILSATIFLSFSAIGTLLAPRIVARIGITRAIVTGLCFAALGNVIFAVSPDFAGLAVGRAVCGIGLGLAAVSGPVMARNLGGVGLVALFGASIQLGIAGGLGLGAILVDAGLDWRATFWISAAVALTALPFLLGHGGVSYEPPTGGGFLRLAFRSGRVWRLAFLFIALFSVPLILGSWLIHYLSVDNSLAAATAGALGFLMFGVSAAAREAGGKAAERGVSVTILMGLAPWLAAVGLVILAIDDSFALALIAVILAGIGFAVPYGPSIVQAQQLFPRNPTEPVALMTLVGTLTPVPLVPLIGSLLDSGGGTEVFIVLAAIVAAGGLLNMRPVSGPLDGADPGAG